VKFKRAVFEFLGPAAKNLTHEVYAGFEAE